MNDHQTPISPAPARFSGLALIAFLLAACSILACAIPFAAASINASLTYAVFAMPAIGLLAAVLGFIATRVIARSEGTTAGRPLALVAIFVGLTAAILQGAFVIGAVRTVAGIRTTLAPIVDTFVSEIAAADDPGARAMLAPAVANNLPPESLASFNTQLTAHIGQYSGAELNTADILISAAELRARATPGAQIPDFDARPVVLSGSTNRAIAYVFLDQAALEQENVLFVDLLVVIPEQDRAITLQQDGPAAAVARALSLSISTSGSP